jgi:Tol biopolymer transport system component
MGEVYRARDTRLDRDVAIKLLPDGVANDATQRTRLEREAKAVAALSHPNILAIHDTGVHDGQFFVVTELLDGETLRAEFVHGALPVKKAIDITVQVARGLAAAHDKGVVHRDLKPENLFLLHDGQVKILDFGLAKLTGAAPGMAGVTAVATAAALSEPGMVMGTVGYMSPEQARGQDVDARADLFALGAVLYEALSGQRAFLRETAVETMTAILREDPPDLTATRPELSPALDQIVRHCLEKNPSERFQTARDVAFALESLSGSRTMTPSGWQTQAVGFGPRRQRVRRVVLAVALLATLVVASLWLGRSTAPRSAAAAAPIAQPMLRATINLPPEAPLAIASQPALGYNSPIVAVSPDGAWLAYVAAVGAGRMLYLRDMSSGDVRALPGTEDAVHPFFSPDGLWIGFLTVDHVKKVARQGGAVISLCEAVNPVLAWWRDPSRIYFTEHETYILSRVAADGGKPEQLLTTDAAGVTRFSDVLPDEQTVFAERAAGIAGDYADVVQLDLQTRKTKPLVRSGYAAKYLAPGYVLFARAGSLMAVRFDMARGEVAGEPVVVASGVAMESLFGMLHASSSNTGVLAYVPGGDLSVGKLAWIDRRGAVEYLDAPERTYGAVDLAPDGSRLAVHVADVNDYIWIWDIRRHEGRRIANAEGEGFPLWSPDGGRLAGVVGTRSAASVVIHEVGPGGGVGEGIRLQHGVAAESWSPHGDVLSILVSLSPFRIGFVGVGKPVKVDDLDGLFPAFSPDGRWLAYVSTQAGTYELFLRSFPDGKAFGQISPRGGIEPRWKPSGDLYYRDAYRWYSTHISTNPAPRWDPPRLVFDTEFIDTPGTSYDVSGDGQRLLVVKRAHAVVQSRIEVVANWFELLERRR